MENENICLFPWVHKFECPVHKNVQYLCTVFMYSIPRVQQDLCEAVVMRIEGKGMSF